MNYQELYDELDKIEITLSNLIDSIKGQEYKEQLRLIMFDVQNKKERIEKFL